MISNQELGKIGEKVASEFLQKKNIYIIECNFRAHYGEIDIVARDEFGTLIFVEVKSRVGDSFGDPVEAVTPRKLREVIKTAQFYLLKNNLDCDWRIDVISVELDESLNVIALEHFENVTL